MAERTINSRAFRTEFIRLTERTAVTANNRVIGIWHPVSVPFVLTGYLDEPDLPAPRPQAETPTADDPPPEEPKGVGDVRTRLGTEALDASSPVPVVGTSGGGNGTAGGSPTSSASTRRAKQAATDKILRGVNRGNKP